MQNRVPLQSNPEWKNWTEDLVRKPSPSGGYYYFSPTNRAELKKIVLEAKTANVKLRVSGQRHSQPPLVAEDDRDSPAYNATIWLVDLSCYADLGTDGTEQLLVDQENCTVTVNAGVREDYLEAYLATQNLMFQTVTAGGFFSLGGMTAVDVNGATLKAPIFAETIVAFSIMGDDGEISVIDETTPAQDGWKAIQFARVSLGALGIVTSVTIKVLPRPWANSLSAETVEITLDSKAKFTHQYLELFNGDADGNNSFDRVESFLNPYDNSFLLLCWKYVSPPPGAQEPNRRDIDVPTSCEFAAKDSFGAPYETAIIEKFSDKYIYDAQFAKTELWAKAILEFGFYEIKNMFNDAKDAGNELWLSEATRTAFISYYIALPNINEDGLGKVWDAIQVVNTNLEKSDKFRVVGPMEFRFVKGGDTALAGTYSTDPNTWYANIDVIAYVPKIKSSEYKKELLDFFAAVEREWYGKYEGIPHNGKMYGFFDPNDSEGSTPPFNTSFLNSLATRRGDRLKAFEVYRKKCDPDNRFCNEFLQSLLLGAQES